MRGHEPNGGGGLRGVCEVMADFDDAMLLTTSDLKPGRLRGRPMHVAEVEADGTLWLFACADGERGREAMADSEAYLVCQSPHHQVFLRGRVTVVGDHARIDARMLQ